MPPSLLDAEGETPPIESLAGQAQALATGFAIYNYQSEPDEIPLGRTYPAPDPVPAPVTPPPLPPKKQKSKAVAAPSKQPKVMLGAPFDPPCLNCLRFAISGKGAFERSRESVGRSQQCVACCAGGYKCYPL
ncbi:hypothetical protein DCS_05941 [Drechmeria coniospora]|uniref:Uncharacterized protein n=1 Tax=Drechmeria coniospora TaxID=98403 RepID=A0A151GA78_DRECN|nr:hypothetical protein DCS_05941 [Drechmeria coniospora]KYK53992.1 hypothetical protein DCS_05941 [Drechmeria coniospora]